METHVIIIIIVVIGLFLLCNQKNEKMRPVTYVARGRPGMKCGTAFVNMSHDQSESEKLYKTCPEGYTCENDMCIPKCSSDNELQGYEQYKWQDYEVA
jgi:hypothetical protein